MFGSVLKKFPTLWDYYCHIEKRKQIKRINRMKKLSWDEKLVMVEKTYNERLGHPLDWNNLHTYTEKMQWAKMYDTDPKKTILSDKYAVREWVADKIGREHLIPLLGVWNTFDEIDFDSLPTQFVLKSNNGSGTNLIIKDKSKLNLRHVRRLVKDWIDTDFAYVNPFEFHYSSITPKIIAEKLIETNSGMLSDYKFLCFDGIPKYVWIDVDRFSNHKRNVYDMNWNLQKWNQCTYGNTADEILKPKNFEKMVDIAIKLSQGFSHVRVDLYNNNGIIYFGEMTFTNGSGFEKIVPIEADMMLGDFWKIDMSKQDGYKI